MAKPAKSEIKAVEGGPVSLLQKGVIRDIEMQMFKNLGIPIPTSCESDDSLTYEAFSINWVERVKFWKCWVTRLVFMAAVKEKLFKWNIRHLREVQVARIASLLIEVDFIRRRLKFACELLEYQCYDETRFGKLIQTAALVDDETIQSQKQEDKVLTSFI